MVTSAQRKTSQTGYNEPMKDTQYKDYNINTNTYTKRTLWPPEHFLVKIQTFKPKVRHT